MQRIEVILGENGERQRAVEAAARRYGIAVDGVRAPCDPRDTDTWLYLHTDDKVTGSAFTEYVSGLRGVQKVVFI